MDLKKAYDKVYRKKLRKLLQECEADGYLIRSMNYKYNGSEACVRFGCRGEGVFLDKEGFETRMCHLLKVGKSKMLLVIQEGEGA